MRCFLFIFGLITVAVAQDNFITQGSSGCSSEETTEEDTKILEECLDEVGAVINTGLDQTMVRGMAQGDFIRDLRRKRDADQVPDFAQKIYGCVLQCMFRKYRVLDEDDLPTRRGLVKLLTEGVSDRSYFFAVNKIVDHCYPRVKEFRHLIQTQRVPGGKYCDVAYDTFFCVSEEIEEYCEIKNTK